MEFSSSPSRHAPSLPRRAVVFALCLGLAALVLALDMRSDPDLSFSILYLVPIVLAAWFAGLPESLVLSMAAAGMWYLWDPENHAPHQHAVALWNSGAMLGIFLAASFGLSRLRASRERLRHFNEILEQTVKERTQELQRSIRELEIFMYTMAHDLRAPLRAIHGYCDLLAEEHGRDVGEEGKEMLHRISGATRRMDKLVLDLLDYGRLIHGAVQLKTVAVRPLLAKAIDDLGRA